MPHKRSRGRWGRVAGGSEGKTLFVKKFCLKMIESVAEEKGIRAKEAVDHIVARWEHTGRRPTSDAWMAQMKGPRLGLLKPKMKEGLNIVTASE